MMSRRALLMAGGGLSLMRPAAALPLLPAGPAGPVPPAGGLAFRLVRWGSEIGRHTLTFESQDDMLTVRVAVDVLVTVFSIPVVRYTHRAVETWQGGVLTGLVGFTDKNGDRQWVRAGRTDEGLEVVGSKAERYIAPESAIGTSYWNRRMVDGPMISLEDGVLLLPKIEMHPAESIRLACGDTIAADHYNLSGAFDIDVWYDQTDTWAGLAFGVADGSHVHYERL